MGRTLRALALAAVALAAPTGLLAEDRVELAFRFTRGDVATYEVTVSGAGHMRPPEGEVVPMGVQGTFLVVCTTTEVLADGGGRIEARVPKANLQMSIGEERVRFSYENGRLRWFANGKEHIPPEAELGQLPLLGTPVVFTMDAKGGASGLTLADPQLLAALQQAAPTLGLGQVQEVGDQMFPEGPVAVGESWRRAVQLLPLGPIMPITVTSSRTLDSYSEQGGVGVARISGYREVRVQWQPTSLMPGEQQVRVAVPELRQTITSTEFFDNSQGRLVRGDYAVGFSTRVSVTMGEEAREGRAEARLQVTVQAR